MPAVRPLALLPLFTLACASLHVGDGPSLRARFEPHPRAACTATVVVPDRIPVVVETRGYDDGGRLLWRRGGDEEVDVTYDRHGRVVEYASRRAVHVRLEDSHPLGPGEEPLRLYLRHAYRHDDASRTVEETLWSAQCTTSCGDASSNLTRFRLDEQHRVIAVELRQMAWDATHHRDVEHGWTRYSLTRDGDGQVVALDGTSPASTPTRERYRRTQGGLAGPTPDDLRRLDPATHTVEDLSQGQRRAFFETDAAGRVVHAERYNGEQRRYRYDALGRPVERIDDGGSGSTLRREVQYAPDCGARAGQELRPALDFPAASVLNVLPVDAGEDPVRTLERW